MNGGVSCVSACLVAFNLATGEKKRITEFNDNNFPESYIESIEWKTDTEIGFSTRNFDCKANRKGSLYKDFIYDIKKKDLFLTKEKIVYASDSGG